MFLVDTLILVTGVLLLLGIASSKFSARLGVPVLVMFLGLGMLAGSEGIGGIEFENYALSHAIGTVALALILFDGGLRTPYRSIRMAWKPAGILATVGVFLTAVITGFAAVWILKVPVLEGMLLGSIVGSTDAAAVFAVLRSGGVHIGRRLSDTLEVESGSNDPMAIFLTVGLIQMLTGQLPGGWGLLLLFLNQLVVGVVVGVAVGKGAVWMIDHIRLDAAGLYPVLATAFGLLAFGLAADLGGSGFLAVYLAGIIIGNSRIVFHRGVLLFHDAGAWLGQISMFIVLGLLSFPSRLIEVAVPGLLIAMVLVLVARPIAIFLCVAAFRFSIREQLFLSWGGLKGAVPITLATFPLLHGMPDAPVLFDIVFFVVLISALVQGWTLPWAARRLGLESPRKVESPVTLEISSLQHVEGDIVDYFIDAGTQSAGRMIRELALPEEVVVALIVRDRQIQLPKGSTRIEAGDHVIVVLRPAVRPMVDRVFARQEGVPEDLPTALEFPLKGSIKVGELEQFYGIRVCSNTEATLDAAIRERLDHQGVALGAVVHCEGIDLYVRELSRHGEIETVGMVILPQPDPEPDPDPQLEPQPETAPQTDKDINPAAGAACPSATPPLQQRSANDQRP